MLLPRIQSANGNSASRSTSAFAGNPLLISLERLAEKGWLDAASLYGLSATVAAIDYEQVNRDKLPLLWQAAKTFLDRSSGESRQRFDRFCQENCWWLDDYVLFDTLRQRHGNNWDQWPSALARRECSAIKSAQEELNSDLAIRRLLQFFFWAQWYALRNYCAQKSIRSV